MFFKKLFAKPIPKQEVEVLLTSNQIMEQVGLMKSGETRQFHARADEPGLEDAEKVQFFIANLTFEFGNPVYGNYWIEDGHCILEVTLL